MELGFVNYIMKFTILRFECILLKYLPVEATTAAFPKNNTKVPTELIAATLRILLKQMN